MTAPTLDAILSTLHQHHQRATYSAVAAIVGQTPRMLMQGKPRAQSNCWIVSKTTGRPTGYADEDLHPQLMSNDTVLKTRDELAAWLSSRASD